MTTRCSCILNTIFKTRPQRSLTSRRLGHDRGLKTSRVGQHLTSQGSPAASHKLKPLITQLEDKTVSDGRSIQDLLSLKGKVTVVTGRSKDPERISTSLIEIGGGRGIGLTLARGAAELGSNVAVFDLLEEPHADFLKLADELGVRTEYYW